MAEFEDEATTTPPPSVSGDDDDDDGYDSDTPLCVSEGSLADVEGVHLDDVDDDDDGSLGDVVLVAEEQKTGGGVRLGVPKLPTDGLRRTAAPPSRNEQLGIADMGEFDGLRVDLLSEAFCFDRECLDRARATRGMSAHGVVTAAFAQALNVPQHQLSFYQVKEITSPAQLDPNKQIAVAVRSSSFSLDAYDALIQSQKKGQKDCDSYRRRIADYEENLRRLESRLEEVTQTLREKERENRQLMQENEALRRRSLAAQRSTPPGQFSMPTLSPRRLASGGSSSQPHLSSSLVHLRHLTAENHQLVSELAQVVRTQAVDNSLR